MDIDEDVLLAAKELAEMQNSTAGRVLSELARKALRPEGSLQAVRNGVPLLPSRPEEGPVTPEIVNRLLDEA